MKVIFYEYPAFSIAIIFFVIIISLIVLSVNNRVSKLESLIKNE